MDMLALFLTAAGLSMDAFAVSVCKGLALPRYRLRYSVLCGAWFGGFQSLMPAVGFILGCRFKSLIAAFDHWIAFILLGLIGFNMIRETLSENEDKTDSSFAPKVMLALALATSIDALAVGITFAFLEVNIVAALLMTGLCTFIISAAGVGAGAVFGARYRSKAEIAGGIILIILALRILIGDML